MKKITYQQMVYKTVLTLSMLVFNYLLYSQDRHIDPFPTETLHKISFSKHVSTTFSSVTVDKLLAFGTEKLQACNNKVNDEQDVACQVKFERNGTFSDFGTATDGLDIVTDLTEDSIVQSKPGFVKIVTAIMLNGTIVTGKVPAIGSSSLILASTSGGTERDFEKLGQTFIHEFGHNQGLLHRRHPGEPSNPFPLVGEPFMHPSAGAFYEVNQAECKAYHNGFNVGDNTKVNRKTRIAFVVDDTGSMGEEIDGVKNGITLALTSFGLFTGNTCDYVYQLVTFKDNVTVRAPTTDLNVIKNQVSALFASGGNDCPEASVEAIEAIKDSVKDNGVVFLFTDASPHAGTNITGVAAALKARGVNVSVLLSGDCTGSFLTAQGGDPIPYSDNHDSNSPGINALSPNPTAIEAYSFLAGETGGIFIFMPEVNTGGAAGRTKYENTVYNLIVGGVAPAVINVEPSTGPVGGTLALTVNSSKTQFNTTTTLAFSDPRIVVNSITIISPTKLQASITVAPTVPLGFKDVVTYTNIGGGVIDSANGRGVFQVIAAPTTPTILSISPVSGQIGQTLTVKVTGINTHFTNTSVLNLGTGVTILNTTALNAVELQAQIQISPAATIGFRNVIVTTGSEVATETVPGPFLVTAEISDPVSCIVGNRLYVDTSSVAGGNGAAWACAYKQLYDAIEFANNTPSITEIWIADGVYKPRDNGNRNETFNLQRNGLRIVGGFSGNETSESQSNVVANPTILSGDLGTAGNAADNAYHLFVLRNLRYSGQLLFKSLIMQGGNATDVAGVTYAAYVPDMFYDSCIIQNNYAPNGGAFYFDNSTARYQFCIFQNNSAVYGGVFSSFQSNVSFNRIFFLNNTAAAGGAYYGNYGSPVFKDVLFYRNTASDGGAVYQNQLNATYLNCVLDSNTATLGGGIYLNSGSTARLVNGTLYGNTASNSGGAIYVGSGNPNLMAYNTIFWNNKRAGSTSIAGSDVGFLTMGTPVTMQYGMLQAGTMIPADNGTTISNNLRGVSPLFRSESNRIGPDGAWLTQDDGLQLTQPSVAVNSGNNAIVTSSGLIQDPTDYARIMCGTVDRGAFELQTCATPTFVEEAATAPEAVMAGIISSAKEGAVATGLVANPFSGELQVRYAGREKASINIISASGKVISTRANVTAGTHRFDATAWGKGLYLVTISTPDKQVITLKAVRL